MADSLRMLFEMQRDDQCPMNSSQQYGLLEEQHQLVECPSKAKKKKLFMIYAGKRNQSQICVLPHLFYSNKGNDLDVNKTIDEPTSDYSLGYVVVHLDATNIQNTMLELRLHKISSRKLFLD